MLITSIKMDSISSQCLDNYVGPAERTPEADNERLLSTLYEATRYKTTDSYDFTPKSSCLGAESNPHFEERKATKENINATIRRHKILRKLFARAGDILILQGIDYELLTVGNRPVVLGEGTFGVAFLAKDIHTNKLVTIKLFKKTGNSKLASILREVGFQMLIDMESEFSFTPKLLGLLIFAESKVPQNCHSFMIVMEYLSVVPEMEKPIKLSLAEAKKLQREGCDVLTDRNWFKITKQLMDITRDLSDMKICHLDLHANNLLLVCEQSKWNVKVIDFGKCVLLDKNTRLCGYDKMESSFHGKELANLKRPLPTSDLFTVSVHMLYIYRHVLEWQNAARIVDHFREQSYRNRWDHDQLFSKLKRLVINKAV